MKIKAVDEFRSMNVKELREQAALRGISTAGTKKEILERLCTDVDENSGDNDQGTGICFVKFSYISVYEVINDFMS